MTRARIDLGRRGEDLAAAYLRGLGMRIRHRNFRVHRGEIDIIAEDDDTLVFVEVRSRGADDSVKPLQTVDRNKERQVRRVVGGYLSAVGYRRDYPVRIDVIGVTFEDFRAHLVHVSGAF